MGCLVYGPGLSPLSPLSIVSLSSPSNEGRTIVLKKKKKKNKGFSYNFLIISEGVLIKKAPPKSLRNT